MTDWTDERVAELRRLWAEGLTALQIARVMGCVSRNSVIGKAHRLGLPKRANGAQVRAMAGAAGRATIYREGRSARRRQRIANLAAAPSVPADAIPWDAMTDDERVAKVVPLLDLGWASQDVAARLATTVHRVRELRRRRGLTSKPSASKYLKGRNLAPIPAAPADNVVVLELAPTRTIMTIGAGECRAIIGEPCADEPAMCGRPAVEGPHPYCEHHHRRFVQRGSCVRRPGDIPPWMVADTHAALTSTEDDREKLARRA